MFYLYFKVFLKCYSELNFIEKVLISSLKLYYVEKWGNI